MEGNKNGIDRRPLIAIINTTIESIELLKEVLSDEGFRTVEAYVIEFKRGMRDLDSFFHDHQPQAVVYDVALPYVQNWTFFQEQLLARGFLPAGCFIVTTTNLTVLEMLVGPTPAIELVGRPFDLERIVEAVKRVVSGM